MSTSETTTEAAATTNNRACACRCGFGVKNAKATYLPGHDARHVSNLLQQAAQDGFKRSTVHALRLELPSTALAHKFTLAAKRAAVALAKKSQTS